MFSNLAIPSAAKIDNTWKVMIGQTSHLSSFMSRATPLLGKINTKLTRGWGKMGHLRRSVWFPSAQIQSLKKTNRTLPMFFWRATGSCAVSMSLTIWFCYPPPPSPSYTHGAHAHILYNYHHYLRSNPSTTSLQFFHRYTHCLKIIC